MKHSLLLSTALLSALGTAAQTSVTVSVGATYADQTHYSLLNGEQARNPLAAWDLGFEINSFTSSILVNTAKGLKVYETTVPLEEWDAVTEADMDTLISNSDEDWSAGALTNGRQLDAEPYHLGWGEYSMDTHHTIGDKIYVVETGAGAYLKLRIDALIDNVYTFTYADLDGGNEVSTELDKRNFIGKNFGYFNFTTGEIVDQEPIAADWDLLFTKYTALVESEGTIVPYSATGVLQNKAVGVVEVDGVSPELATWAGEEFDLAINTIGYNWKDINMATFQWDINTERTYFVQDRSGNIWKIVFTAFGGSSTGDFTFTQEMVGAASVGEQAHRDLVVFPNPSTNSQLNIVLSREVRNGQLSIMDRTGRLVKQQVVNGTGALGTVPVDLAGVNAGLYLVRLDAEGMVYTTRVVVE